MQIISVMNRKGGVGKTTISVNLACALHRRVPTLLLDCDDQGSASKWMRNGEVPVLVAESAGEIRQLLADVTDADVVVADGPPYDPDINRALYQAADLVLVPVGPSALDIDGAEPILTSLTAAGRSGLVVLSQVDNRSVIQNDARAALAAFDVPVANTEVSRRIDHARAVLARQPVISYRPSSLAAFEINELADQVADLLEL